MTSLREGVQLEQVTALAGWSGPAIGLEEFRVAPVRPYLVQSACDLLTIRAALI